MRLKIISDKLRGNGQQLGVVSSFRVRMLDQRRTNTVRNRGRDSSPRRVSVLLDEDDVAGVKPGNPRKLFDPEADDDALPLLALDGHQDSVSDLAPGAVRPSGVEFAVHLDYFRRPAFCHGLAADLAVVDDPKSSLFPDAVSVRWSEVPMVGLKQLNS